MTDAMGSTFSTPAPRRGVLAPPAADALEPDDETPDEEIDEKVDTKPKRTRRQRPPATRSDR